ncbi:MAG TPA: hypothetical protein VN697_05860 [Tepidiformaceae bacterium]|nr:hypothetical protein [Tepidiformaceae bacterium]
MTSPISAAATGAAPAPPSFQPPDLNALTRSQGASAISALITNTALVQSLFPNPSLFPAVPQPSSTPIDGLLQSAFTYELASSGNSAALRMLLGQQPGQLIDKTA